MAKRVKAQKINQVASKETANKTDKILVSSSAGVTNSIELGKLTSIFGAGSGGSGGSGEDTGSSRGAEKIDVNLNTFNTSTFYAKTYNPTSQIAYTSDNMKAYTDAITITEDSSVYATAFIQTDSLAEGQFGIEFKDASGKWFPIKSGFTRSSSSSQFEGSTELAIYAYSGCMLRAFATNGIKALDNTPIKGLTLYVTAVKGSAWSKNSRSLTLTIGQTIDGNGLYVSPEAKFGPSDSNPTAVFPNAYDGALITVNGYFSLGGSNKTNNFDDTYQNVYLQYCKPGSSIWSNFASLQVSDTKTNCKFGTFFIERGTKIRLASTDLPTTKSIHSPYPGCTAVIQYTAVNRKTGEEIEDEENPNLCILTDVLEYMSSKAGENTVFDFTVPNLTTSVNSVDPTQAVTLRFNNMKFYGSTGVISWDDRVVQRVDENGIFWHQYGYGTNVGSKTYKISASGLQTLGISRSGNPTDTLPINHGSIKKLTTLCGLTNIKLGSSVRYLDNYCFADLLNLTSITIPGTVKCIGGNYTFATTGNVPKISKLKKIEFAGNTTSCFEDSQYLYHTFENLSNLTSLNVEKLAGVVDLRENVFSNTALTCVNIPNGCKNVDWKAFSSMKNLKCVILPSTVKKVTNPTSRIRSFSDQLDVVGIKLSGDASNYTDILVTSKVANEMRQVFQNGLSAVYDIGMASKSQQHDISAVALTKDGKKFVIQNQLLVLNCRNSQSDITLIDSTKYSEYFRV